MRKKILDLLKQHQNTWLSGSRIGDLLGISRNAVNKHISGLKQLGYEIDSVPKKGYQLGRIPELLLPYEIFEIDDQRLFDSEHSFHIGVVDSTNEKVKSLYSKYNREGLLVIAEEQTLGRGRAGHSWFSPAHSGIYASFVLTPSIAPHELSLLTMMTTLALVEVLVKRGFDAEIKWPNDIFIHGKKIGGILIESQLEMDLIHHAVVGFGLNVNTDRESLQTEKLEEQATSLMLESGKQINRVELLRDCLLHFQNIYLDQFIEQRESIISRWKSFGNFFNKAVCLQVGNQCFEGVIKDVEPSGALVFVDSDSKTHRFFSGSLRFI